MSERSANLDMPYLLPSQAQKHVTHNEALQHLDAVVQTVVSGFAETTPPTASEPGDCHALGTGATGDWAGRDAGELAYWTGAGWLFVTPREGWRAWGTDAAELRVFQGGAWVVATLSELGINTDANTMNRLSVASEATLLTHDGSGHQLKINKSATTDTASLLFQTDWTGHAEMGLAGNNSWSLKVSPDGTAWTQALVVDKDTGDVGVGTSSPDTALHISGTDQPAIRLTDESDGRELELRIGDIDFDSDRLYSESSSFSLYHQGSETTRFAKWYTNFYTNGVERMRIQPDGNVGIGTDSPDDALHVSGSLRASGGTGVLARLSTNLNNAYLFLEDGGGRGVSFDTTSQPNYVLDGNFGVGTATPGSKLSVVGLPTSSAGLSAGDIWIDGDTLKIVT